MKNEEAAVKKQVQLSYQSKSIQEKWQKFWDESGTYSPDIAKAAKPFYNLMMFPYPSAEGLHVGNMYAFTGSDIYGRYKRMLGYDVFEPIGLDAFGIHSENFALKTNTHPLELSKRTEANFYRQLKLIGNGYDWSHTLETNKKDYYKWTQWLFLQLYKKGLVEKKEAPVNWCPSCLTVLSDEQVIAGRCERCSTEVVIKHLSQWFFKITAYADRLLANLDWIDWDESVKVMQRNWIGKQTGAEIFFNINTNQNMSKDIKVFTTRPDTLFGVTGLVLSPEHPLIPEIVSKEYSKSVSAYIIAHKHVIDIESTNNSVKTGVKTGAYAIHPLTHEKVPVWISDYVIGSYGTGAIMLVPAHDQRDYEFAKQFDIKIKQVVVPQSTINGKKSETTGQSNDENGGLPYEGYGLLINSGEFTHESSENASEKIVQALHRFNFGSQKTTYHIRDWLISRQRYWGPPIPIVYCIDCGVVPVKEADLPIELPYIDNFRPTGTGKSPLALHPEFYETTCPNCSKKATRETDVSDTFLDSAWYFLRYPSNTLDTKPFDPVITRKWLPVDRYIGGKEHTVLHLLYSRFVTMVLHDLGYIDFEEPFSVFRAHGLLVKDGAKISKSRGNIINPDEYIEKYGSDTFRTYLMFLGPYAEGGDFRDTGINGIVRFMNKIHRLVIERETATEPVKALVVPLNKTIKKVTDDIEVLRYNTAISAVMELANTLDAQPTVSLGAKKIILQLIAPFAPYITEELWHQLGEKNSIHVSRWPSYDPKSIIEDQVVIVIQINGKTRGKVTVPYNSDEAQVLSSVTAQAHVQKYLTGKAIRKSIYIANRLLNLVV